MMPTQNKNIGLILMICYMVLVLAAFFFCLYLNIYHTANSEFAGVYLVVLTLPWCLVFIILQFPLYMLFGKAATFVILVACLLLSLINARFLYSLGCSFAADE